jgi:hypothetical protein
MPNLLDDQSRVELSVLKKYGLRYAILAAWAHSLRDQGIAVPSRLAKPFETARVKISSGCFSVCDVGCDLGRIEAVLFTTATTAGQETADSWVDMLGECMSETANVDEIEKRIDVHAVKMHYNRFKFGGACGECEA